MIQRATDLLAHFKGLPVIIGMVLVILSLVGHYVPLLAFLSGGELLLHLGIIIGLGGLLFTDTL